MTKKTPYHTGELIAQDKAGTRGVAAELAVGMRDSLKFSSNHDAFLAAQSFAVVTSVNPDNDRIWVTPLFGKPGDLQAATETEISISHDCIIKGDVLRSVQSGAALSLLGIDLDKRIRHRINGVAVNHSDGANTRLHFEVREYSPNCPKYINRRKIVRESGVEPLVQGAMRQQRSKLTDSDQKFVISMDTLWIGTHAPGIGADTNHRGGKPGFIRVTSPTTIEWPEYRGNGMFFTSGNLELHKHAGVTLVDFETGSVLQMSGLAEVDWQHDGRYEGATRVIKFQIEALVRTDEATTLRWERLDYSPYNPEIAGTDSRDGDSDYPVEVTLAKIVEEADNVKTFRFIAPRPVVFRPGQYATFEFENIPGGAQSEVRTWTLSETPNSLNGDNTLDITVKRVPNGLVTNWLHDHADVDLKIKLNGVQGEMTPVMIDSATNQPTVPEHLLLLSGGIGITPNMAILRGVGAFDLQDQTRITMIHIERFEKDLLFQNEIIRRANNYPNFAYHRFISSEEGRLSKSQLQSLLSHIPQQQAYVCGPSQFMSTMTEYLVDLGVPPANVHTESFEF